MANKLNEYFTNIGPDLASSVNTSNKAPFDSYLNTPCSNVFLYQYTNPTDIVKIICQLMEALKGHVKFLKTVCVSPN